MELFAVSITPFSCYNENGDVMKNKSLFIIISVLACCIIMTLIDTIVQPAYFMKSIWKILLFLMIPMIYFIIHKDERDNVKQLFIPNKNSFLISVLLGIGVYIIIIVAYFIFRGIIDFSSIQESLMKNGGITKDNFIFVAIYISFINSLLEEFFFRSYAFISLKNQTNKLFAYIFSSVLFAFYHVGMTMGWFHPIIYILTMLSLAVGGCIFNYLNEKLECIYSSWFVHMFANFAINTIGFMLFNII